MPSDVKEDVAGYRIFAVYDGHAGSEAVTFACGLQTWVFAGLVSNDGTAAAISRDHAAEKNAAEAEHLKKSGVGVQAGCDP